MATTIVTTSDVDVNDFGCKAGKLGINWDNMDCDAVNDCIDDQNDIAYDPSTGTLTLTTVTGGTETVNLPVENFLSAASFDDITNDLTLTLVDGTTVTVALDDLVDTTNCPAVIACIESEPFDCSNLPTIS